MIRSFIYLNEIVEDEDDILWFPSGLKREFSPHFARLLASLCDEGKGEGEQGGARGVEWATLTHGREILECSGGRDMSDQVWLLFGRSSANTPSSFYRPTTLDPKFLMILHLPYMLHLQMLIWRLSLCLSFFKWINCRELDLWEGSEWYFQWRKKEPLQPGPLWVHVLGIEALLDNEWTCLITCARDKGSHSWERLTTLITTIAEIQWESGTVNTIRQLSVQRM